MRSRAASSMIGAAALALPAAGAAGSAIIGPSSIKPKPSCAIARCAIPAGSTLPARPTGVGSSTPPMLLRSRGDGSICPSVRMTKEPSGKRLSVPIAPSVSARAIRPGRRNKRGRNNV
ncbi:hypothetical protein [Paenibacillus sp. OV219]|uniref:hypothetical protein n=1 Tax=Paenibacillus sp. OV219 TaxID=1884377 RepID=UPI00210F1041|nr:hypothetical protein [Paenibacillus sp. OV219]